MPSRPVPDERARIAHVLGRFGEPLPPTGETEVAVRLTEGVSLADVVRAVDAEGLGLADVEIRAPDARRRLPREDRALSRRLGGRLGRGGSRRAGGGGGADPGDRPAMTVVATQVGAVAQRSVRRTLRQPAAIVFPLVFPIMLLLVNAGGLKASTALPGFPTDSFLAFALAVPFIQGALFATMNAGTDLARDIQTGFLNRLALTPIRGSALLAGTLAGIVVMGVAQAVFYLAVGVVFGVDFAAGWAGVPVLLAFAGARGARIRRVRLVPRAADGLGRGGPVVLPRLLRPPLHLLDEHAARPHRRRLVPVPRDDQPGLVPASSACAA